MSPMLDLNEDRDVRAKALLLGHIRLGTFGGKYPTQSETFVFTSTDRGRLEPLAQDFGGIVESYTPQGAGSDTYRLISEADSFTALFAFPDLDGTLSQDWMLWGRGGLKRRCDGVTCAVLDVEPETGEITEETHPCICRARDRRECQPETRIRFLLPQAGLGIWELTTHSKIAAMDLHDQLRFIAEVAKGNMNRLPVRVVYAPREIHYFDEQDQKRKTTTKRLVSLSVAGDAENALRAVSLEPNHALIAAVRTALHDAGRELVGITSATLALEAGEDSAAEKTTLAYGEGVGGSEAADEPSQEPGTEASGLSTSPAPLGDEDEPASAEHWDRATAVGLTGAKALKLAKARWGVTSQSAITKGQLAELIREAMPS